MKSVKKHSLRTLISLLFTVVFSFINSFGFSQDNIPLDTLKQVNLDEVVITANMFENSLINCGSAISSINYNEISTLPANSFSGLLRYLPGLFVSYSDGSNNMPIVNVRGFHGGGESEYLVVLLDGLQLNDIENGKVNWNAIPLDLISKIEILRGGSSALYGDAAIGGVLNLITKQPLKNRTNLQFEYGSFQTLKTGLYHTNLLKKGNFSIYANYDKSNGYRQHSNSSNFQFGGKFELKLNRSNQLTISSNNYNTELNQPGPINDDFHYPDYQQSDPYFKSDMIKNYSYNINAQIKSVFSDRRDLTTSLSYNIKSKEEIRTYVQPPLILEFPTFQPIGIYDTTLYGNSKNRLINTSQSGLKIHYHDQSINGRFETIAGLDLDHGSCKNKVYDVFKGFDYTFQEQYRPYDSLDSKENVSRLKAALFINSEMKFSSFFSMIAGIRYDVLKDDFKGEFPVKDTTNKKYYQSINPKIAFNYITGNKDSYRGSVFVNIGSSFKAPTLDQRTDQKRINYAMFLDFGPFYNMIIINSDPFSNPELEPQKSLNFEIGTYQTIELSNKLTANINFSGYQTYIENEIDFDLAEFKYRNIQSSSHLGFEAGIAMVYDNKLTVFSNINLMHAKFSSGDYNGNFLKGVPKSNYNAGIQFIKETGLGGSIVFNGVSSTYLDDENIFKSDPYTTMNVRLSYKFTKIKLYLDIENLFDKEFISTGYVQYGSKLVYPGMGRFIRGGLSIDI
ncbi:MAG: hypothetical protein CVT92_04575 [Bacteroidetes bacterium HGW-Bacteroidetes-1]|jgi:outer membrane cobalamin receptor|nr:MAG: hypothetical protein CVT92_04575 [Bacteroidetes bacterium HGW-Bacteroidetes-1]